MSKELIERIDAALRVKDAWVADGQIEATAQLLRDCRAELAARGEAASPVGWLYESTAGVCVFHKEDSPRLSADMKAASDYPKDHQVKPLYAAPVNERLLEALRELCAMYANTWDRADDGAPLMIGSSVDRFEAAHAAAQEALAAADAAPGVTDELRSFLACEIEATLFENVVSPALDRFFQGNDQNLGAVYEKTFHEIMGSPVFPNIKGKSNE
jgi:hypothetical protein